jgi:hypothetical protein
MNREGPPRNGSTPDWSRGSLNRQNEKSSRENITASQFVAEPRVLCRDQNKRFAQAPLAKRRSYIHRIAAFQDPFGHSYAARPHWNRNKPSNFRSGVSLSSNGESRKEVRVMTNQTILVGRLIEGPELVTSETGRLLPKLRIATGSGERAAVQDRVCFMIQPVGRQWRFYPCQGRESRRSEESVKSWRYAILESDEVPASHWPTFLVLLPVPIQAIYSSGGDSVHALRHAAKRSGIRS